MKYFPYKNSFNAFMYTTAFIRSNAKSVCVSGECILYMSKQCIHASHTRHRWHRWHIVFFATALRLIEPDCVSRQYELSGISFLGAGGRVGEGGGGGLGHATGGSIVAPIILYRQ